MKKINHYTEISDILSELCWRTDHNRTFYLKYERISSGKLCYNAKEHLVSIKQDANLTTSPKRGS